MKPDVHTFWAESLGDFIKCVSIIAEQNRDPTLERNRTPPRLWFRGMNDWSYHLQPTIQRSGLSDGNIDTQYVENNLREESEYQFFQAKIYHMANDRPSNVEGWQELLQHYSGQTRYLDWSESALVSLRFALSSNFLSKPGKSSETPCVWVLNPIQLNRIGYDILRQYDSIKKAVECYGNDYLVSQMSKHLTNSNRYFSPTLTADNARITDYVSTGIPCLSALEEMISNPRYDLKEMLRSGEMNPYYYLILRYYADAIPVTLTLNATEKTLPPLAVFHPYHSTRIRAQQGVFTIFPNYIFPTESALSPTLVNKSHMDQQPLCRDALYCIRITDASRILQELASSGNHYYDLFPEIEQYSLFLKSI